MTYYDSKKASKIDFNLNISLDVTPRLNELIREFTSETKNAPTNKAVPKAQFEDAFMKFKERLDKVEKESFSNYVELASCMETLDKLKPFTESDTFKLLENLNLIEFKPKPTEETSEI